IAPYQAYVPTPARISGRADVEVTAVLPPASQGSATVRGQAALSGIDVRDEQRTVMRIDRATATGLDIEWPRHVAVRQLMAQRPRVLLERGEAGVRTLRTLLADRGSGAGPGIAGTDRDDRGGVAPSGDGNGRSTDGPGEGLRVALDQLVIEDGVARIVDRAI